MPTYWQIAAGSDQRDYSCLFLKYGIAFAGGGLEERVNLGDIMVLKQGKTAITAVGVVVERDGIDKGHVDKEGYVVDKEEHVNKEKRKEWLLDHDGWVLPEFCYVDWRKPNAPIPVAGLNIGTIQRLNKQEPKDVANDILNTGTIVPISPEPTSEIREVTDDKILKFLIEEGLRPSSSDEITSTISKIRLLAGYYYDQGYPWGDIGEHEARTFLVVPLLLALGWSEQQIKIELNCTGGKIDIACFRKPCKSNNRKEWEKECVAIIETKNFGAGLDYAHQQAKTYSEYFPHCQAVIATNGYCYKVYLRDQDNQFQTTPSAYINLLKPRDKYPLDPENVEGALKAIKWLLPNNLILSTPHQSTPQRPE